MAFGKDTTAGRSRSIGGSQTDIDRSEMTFGGKPDHLVRVAGTAGMKQKPGYFDILGRRKRLDLDKRRVAARSIAPVPVTSMQRLRQHHHRHCKQPTAKGMNAKSVTLKSASHFSVSTMGS